MRLSGLEADTACAQAFRRLGSIRMHVQASRHPPFPGLMPRPQLAPMPVPLVKPGAPGVHGSPAAVCLSQQADPTLLPAGTLLPVKSTSAFVGKIAPSVEDAIIQALLEACGPVKSWKRMLVSHL